MASVFALVSCASDDGPTSTGFAPDVIAIDVSLRDGGFYLSCPSGERCDASFPYRAFAFDEPRVALSVSFAGVLANGYSLEAFRARFEYARILVRLSDGFLWESAPLKAIELTAYGQQRLAGRLATTMTGSLRSSSTPCTDAAGRDGTPGPECSREVTRPVPVVIDFNLTVPPESATQLGAR